MTNIKVVLFDLGGVLVELNNAGETFGLKASEDEFLDLWIRSPSVRQFECGAIDAESFARSIVAETGLPYGWREFLERFSGWPDRLYPGALELLDRIPQRYRRGLLSNTNAIHWCLPGIAAELEQHFEPVVYLNPNKTDRNETRTTLEKAA